MAASPYTSPFVAVETQYFLSGVTYWMYYSDAGYRRLPTDSGGVVPYPPRIVSAVTFTRQVDPSPDSDNVSLSWGAVSLANLDGAYDTIAATANNDSLPTNVYFGKKTYDADRGYWVDPAYATLKPIFTGLGSIWYLTDTALVIPLRDYAYWMDRQLQRAHYDGTGTYDGNATLAGIPKPKTRGAAWNVTPVLIDPTYLIYQYTDAAGTIVHLWEGGKATYTFDSDTTNLYSGTTPAGKYRTDNSRGLFQLGTAPTYSITADVTGSFPTAGYKSALADIARYLLAEDILLPGGYIDTTNFAAVASAYPATGGWHWPSTENPTCVQGIAPILAGLGAKLVPQRSGKMGLFVLRKLTGSETPVATLDTSVVESVTVRPLPETLAKPPYRARIGYKHNSTVQTSGLNPTATAAQVQYAANADLYGVYQSTGILVSYTRVTELDPIPTALDTQSDASDLAQAWIELFGDKPRVLDMAVPVDVGIDLEIGSVVTVAWPIDGLSSGALGQVIGDNYNSTSETMTITVLV